MFPRNISPVKDTAQSKLLSVGSAGRSLSDTVRTTASCLAVAGLILATVSTVGGFLAPWWPALDLINHFRPLLSLGIGLLLVLGLWLRSTPLSAASAALITVNLALLIAPALRYGAPEDPSTAPTFRVATLNTWVAKGQANRITEFVERTKADVILLQEVGQDDQAAILDELSATYPYVLFDQSSRLGPALLSKRPWTNSGSLPTGRGRPLSVWARFERDGRSLDVASVHTANPLEWQHQPGDIDRLIEFAHARGAPLILGGDFNLTPFSWGLVKLAEQADLRWGQTFSASWPAHKLIPVVLLDHVLVSEGIVLTNVQTGPRVGSDHLPIVADIILSGQRTGTAQAP